MNTLVASRWSAALAGALLCVAGVGVANAANVDRKLSVSITVDGKQDWKNELQWSKATTRQAYDFSTTLRSNGKLYAANLLDPDLDTRLAIKTEYLRQQGLVQLKASGFDPQSKNLLGDVSSRAQQDNFSCKGDTVCISEVGAKYAALMAAAVEPDNSALFEGEGRYQFFFGYPGCQNLIHAVHKYSANGETAYGRKKDKIFPYQLTYDGDSTGNDVDRKSMCTYYTVVIDTLEKKMYVENTVIPEARGKVSRTEFGKTNTTEDELPVPAPLQGWVNETLRLNTLSGNAATTLPLNLPLDGNATVMGLFTGEAKTTLKWSWTDLAGTAPAPAAAKPAAATKPAAK